MGDVFLHVGLAKTGTTTIQAALEACAPALATHGVLYPGGTHRAQRTAVYDLLGHRVRGDERGQVTGAFSRLAEEMAGHRGRSVVISEEKLSLVRPREVRALVRALDGHRVFVVVGVRDMARTLVSAWQQSVVNGGTTPWLDFVASVQGDEQAPPSEGIGFWLRHDLLRVVDTWSTAVPSHRIRVVTIPPAGAGSAVLLERFAEAAELPAHAWSPPVAARNVSLGPAELEVVRRLNASLGHRLTTGQHRFVIESGIRARLAGAGDRPLVLPESHLDWARAYGERLAAEVERLGLAVVGDLSELVPAPREPCASRLDAVDGAGLLAATEAALTSVALDHGRLFRRYRRDLAERERRWPGAAEVLGSEARAGSFQLRKWGLRLADQHPPIARAARRYLAWTSPTRIRP